MRLRMQIAVVSAGLLMATPSLGDEILRFQFMTEVAKSRSKLLYGHPIDPRDWPALVTTIVGSTLQEGRRVPVRCSGALVGKGVLLTAAHCVDPGAGETIRKIELELAPGSNRTLNCTVPAVYLASKNAPPRTADDFALCTFLIPEGVRLPPAEVIETELAPQARDPILLTGFGCQEMEFKFGTWRPVPTEGQPVLTVADASISMMPTPSNDFRDGFISIISSVANGQDQPVLCSGDSGGPMLTGATLAMQAARRRIVGVNSWVQQVRTSNSLMRSGIASLSSPGFVKFARSWSMSNPAFTICGLGGQRPVEECRR